MSVTLPPEIEQRIQHWIDDRGYPDATAVIRRALEALEAQEKAQLDRMRELVLAARDNGKRRELTPEVMDEIERRSEEQFQRGEQPRPHVCP